jgi:hypothetical protein
MKKYFVSSNAHNLIDSYRDLVTQTNTKSCTYDNSSNPGVPHVKGTYYCTYSAMSAKGYNVGTAGYISFSSWYWHTHTEPKTTMAFHTAWFSSELKQAAVLCPDCYQKPLVNPFPATTDIDNHVFEVILVPVSVYRRRKMTTVSFLHAEDATNPFATVQIKAINVAKIHDVSVEAAGGYMDLHVTISYNNVHSSVGLMCDVLLKSGKSVKCYIFNNYDGSQTMVWKQKYP